MPIRETRFGLPSTRGNQYPELHSTYQPTPPVLIAVMRHKLWVRWPRAMHHSQRTARQNRTLAHDAQAQHERNHHGSQAIAVRP